MLLIIGIIIYLLTSRHDGDYISEVEEKLFDHSLDDLHPIEPHEQK